ncbi:MAG: TolC family protein [Tannerella sp.]|jgi:outer membrane protein TolC|nr:TolC family protein [Tannerella sp.]
MKKKTILYILIFLIVIQGKAFGQNDSLNYYLQIAAENNPGVRAAFSLYEASLERVPQVSGLPDPQFEMGFFLKPMELLEGQQVAQFELMQMFPWFGVRKSAATEAQAMAKMAYEEFREARDQLWLDVYTQWFTLASLQQQLNNNIENRQLLVLLEELALRRSSSPSGDSSSGLSDVLRIQMEMAEIDNGIESLHSEIQAEKVKFNALLNRSPVNEVHVPDSIVQIPFLTDELSIMNQIAQKNPMLGMLNEEEAAYKAKAEMDRKMSYPMFGVGLQYMFLNKGIHAASMGDMNGKDMIMPMLSVSIPIYRNKYRAQQRESAFRQQAARQQRDNTLNMLEAEFRRAKNELDNAARSIDLYRRQSQLAQTTYNLVVQEFASGKGDLTNVIQVQRQLLDFKLKTAEAIATYNTMAANIQKLMSSNEK